MIKDSKQDPLSIFVYVLRAPETKRQYPKRVQVVLDFLGFDGSLAVKAADFLTSGKENKAWAEESLMKFRASEKTLH